MRWRLGIDLGTNSLGWAAVALNADGDPERIVAMGSRIFSDGRDPKSGASLAVDRRAARAMRRRLDRFERRKQALLRHLTLAGLFPSDPAEREKLKGEDPFALRATALDAPLPLHHVGRAFFHLNQRRGFKSNRKTDRGADDEAGKITIGVDRLRGAIAEMDARTFGEFLHKRRRSAPNDNTIPSVRTRLRPETGDGAKRDGYDFYPGRALVEDEFEAIWRAQAPHHAAMTPELHDRLFEVIFHQRPLKKPRIGTCTLIAGDTRLPKAHPLFQRRRLLEEINALTIATPGESPRRLTRQERDALLTRLRSTKAAKFESLRKGLKLDPDARFNKESENRTELKGDEVAALMAATTRFGPAWLAMPTADQWTVIERLEATESDAEMAAFRVWLEERHGLAPARAAAVSLAHLPQGYGRFGLEATTRLIDALERGGPDGAVVVYSEAVQLAGLGHHSDLRTGEVPTWNEARKPKRHEVPMPYYGAVLERHLMPGTGDESDPEELRIGRLTNPTVHIGLNQLRRVVNALIARYGPPAEIAIELARDLKQTEDEKKTDTAKNTKNRLDAERRSRVLRGVDPDDNPIGPAIVPDTGANRALLKLWEELNPGNVLDRCCVYCGETIGIEALFSARIDVDHILPFAATLDDSNANKIVCHQHCNQIKRRRSPYQAWGHTAQWDAIAARAARMPRNKRWRFEPDAMERFDSEDKFLARHLKDTQYLSRLSHEYVSVLYPDRGEGSRHVWVSPGRLTAMIRRKLGLDRILRNDNMSGPDHKNRNDHRHHAIDALVVAVVDRAMLMKMARISALQGEAGRALIDAPPPWEGFRDDAERIVNAITVSHRPDHGSAGKAGLPRGKDATAGRLHNDTAYGFTGETDAKGLPIVVRRKMLNALKPADLPTIRDPDLRAALEQATRGLEGKAFEAARDAFPTLTWHPYPRIRHVRVVEPLTVIPIRDRNGRIYKGYKGDSNYRYDVWQMPDGAWVTHWKDRDGVTRSSIVSMFDAHQAGEQPRPHPAARKALSLHQDDLIAIERAGEPVRFMRVVKFGQNGQITLAEPNEAGDLKRRDTTGDDPFKYYSPTCGGLKKARARKIGLDELGRVSDPGFPARTAVRRTRCQPAWDLDPRSASNIDPAAWILPMGVRNVGMGVRRRRA